VKTKMSWKKKGGEEKVAAVRLSRYICPKEWKEHALMSQPQAPEYYKAVSLLTNGLVYEI